MNPTRIQLFLLLFVTVLFPILAIGSWLVFGSMWNYWHSDVGNSTKGFTGDALFVIIWLCIVFYSIWDAGQ